MAQPSNNLRKSALICVSINSSFGSFRCIFELYKATIVFFKPKLLTNKHYEDTDGTGTIPLITLIAIWSISALTSLPGLAVSPIIG
jgi:hypothetical protein